VVACGSCCHRAISDSNIGLTIFIYTLDFQLTLPISFAINANFPQMTNSQEKIA